MTTYNWKIVNLNVAPSDSGLTDVVKSVSWKYIGTDGSNTSNVFGLLELSSPQENSFINFNDIQEADVISWLESNLSIADIKAVIDAKILEQTTPVLVTKTVPWDKSQEITE